VYQALSYSCKQEEEGECEQVLMPLTARRVGCLLNVAVYRAEGLPQMDFTPGTLTVCGLKLLVY
jgi:hypothetical protein